LLEVALQDARRLPACVEPCQLVHYRPATLFNSPLPVSFRFLCLVRLAERERNRGVEADLPALGPA